MVAAPQPIGTNWSNIFRTGGIVLAVVGAAALWIMGDPFTPNVAPKEEPRSYSDGTGGAKLSFDDTSNRGYTKPPPPSPSPPPSPLPYTPPPAVAPAKTEPASSKQQMPQKNQALSQSTRKRAAIALIGEDGSAGNADQQQQQRKQIGSDEYRPGMSDGVDKVENRMGNDAAENRWLASAGTRGDDFVTSPLMPPISNMMLKATTMIPGTVVDEASTELPDEVGALVDHDILDSIYGKCVLIPYASIIYGRTNNQVADFQTRGQGAITRILFPDGKSRNIGAMNLTDQKGRAGVEAEVDRHIGAMAASIAGAGVFAVLSQSGQMLGGNGGDDQVNIVGVGGSAAGQQTSSIGQQMVQRQLNRPNTLGMPVGWPVAVTLTKDMALPPYVSYPNYPECDA